MKHREIMFRCCLKGNRSEMHSDKMHELRCRARNSGLKAVELLSKVPKVPLIDRFCSVVKLAVKWLLLEPQGRRVVELFCMFKVSLV